MTKSVLIRPASKFIWIAPLAQYRSRSVDYSKDHLYLSPNISDGELGAAVKNVLSLSSQVSAKDIERMRAASTENEKKWADSAVEQYGYSSRRSLYADIPVVIDLEDDGKRMHIQSLYHQAGLRWVPKHTKDGGVVILSGSENSKVGRTLRSILANADTGVDRRG